MSGLQPRTKLVFIMLAIDVRSKLIKEDTFDGYEVYHAEYSSRFPLVNRS